MKRLAILVALCACGSDNKTKMDAPASHDAPRDSGPVDSHHDAVPPDAPLDGPPGTQQLIVRNYQAWCSVSVNGGSASLASQQIVFVTPGTYPLTATKANDNFEIGPKMWHHTDGDTQNMGEDGVQVGGTSSAMVTVGSALKCVWVCCPFTSGAGCDPASIGEQCD